MRSTLLALTFVLCCTALGQQSSIGFSGGPSLCRLNGNNIFKQVDPVAGFQVGGQYTRWFKRGLGVQSQLTYARMGGALDYIGFNANGDETSRDHINYRFDHLGLSIGAAYRTPGRVHGLLALGLMPSLVVAAEVRSPDTFYHPGDIVVTDLTEKVNSPVLFAYGAFGGAVDLKAPITIGLLIRYDHGLTTLSRSDFFENENIIETSWCAMLTLAYRWSRASN